MKIRIILTVFVFIPLFIWGQTSKNYSVKAGLIYGEILKHTIHLQNLVKGPVMGAEFDIEWQTMGEESWHQFYRFPTIGLGIVGLDLGNPSMLGQLTAIYPYLNYRLIDAGIFRININGGAGASFLNKRFSNTATDVNDQNTGNAAIGSIVNVYFSGGGNLEIPLGRKWMLLADFNWNHASNGSFYQPNSGINMLNAKIGMKYSPNTERFGLPVMKTVESLPQTFKIELIASGGARQLYYKDNKMFPTGSVVLAAFRQLGNNLRLGAGIDGFYDGVYDGNTKYKRTYLTENDIKNKIRLGVSLQPELVFGRLSAGIHFGLYLYNPLKNLEPYADAQSSVLNKPLIYSYNIEQEDGWLYTRAALKYSFTKHLFLSLGLKTHLQKAEFIEWGLGFRL